MTVLRSIANNRIGQQLGTRGQKTRKRLLAAAEELLRTTSPLNLNATAIARKAGTSPATFYVYFDDVRELLFDLSLAAVPDSADLFPRADSLLDPARIDEDAAVMVDAINAAWDRHATILLYRNLEADRGDMAFQSLRYDWAEPILRHLAEAMRTAGSSAGSDEEIAADAVVLLAAVERIAATTHQDSQYGPTPKFLHDSLVRMICRSLR